MRLLKYLNEDEDTQSYIDTIKKDCQPFLKDWRKYGGNPLYTGRKGISKDFIKKTVRKDRQPKDTPQELHELMDYWFYKKFGIKFRSNAVFVTTKHSVAKDYGLLFYIFPIGKYTMCYSPTINDIYNLIYNYTYKTFHLYSDGLDISKDLTKEDGKKLKDWLTATLKSNNYTTKFNLKHENEIMLNCKEYYLVFSSELDHQEPNWKQKLLRE